MVSQRSVKEIVEVCMREAPHIYGPASRTISCRIAAAYGRLEPMHAEEAIDWIKGELRDVAKFANMWPRAA